MSDPRFTTAYSSTDDLLEGLDLDDVDDVETLLMFLFARPFSVGQVWDDDEHDALEVAAIGDEQMIGSTYDFPLSVVDLVRWCSELLVDVGSYSDGSVAGDATSPIGGLPHDDLIVALQRSLGSVRIFNLMEAGEE